MLSRRTGHAPLHGARSARISLHHRVAAARGGVRGVSIITAPNPYIGVGNPGAHRQNCLLQRDPGLLAAYTGSSYPMTRKLKNGLLTTPKSRSQMGIIISAPRAVVMSPRSMRCFQP